MLRLRWGQASDPALAPPDTYHFTEAPSMLPQDTPTSGHRLAQNTLHPQ